jgi:hypothetical protein
MKKRFIVIECRDDLSTMFVAVHEGDSICMTPLLAETLTEQCAASVKAVPVDNIVDCPISRPELLRTLEKYVFHGDWNGDTDWHGNRYHVHDKTPVEIVEDVQGDMAGENHD